MSIINGLGDWLSKTDPTVVLPILGTVFVALWHKIKGDKKESWSSIIADIVKNLARDYLDRYKRGEMTYAQFANNARDDIEKMFWKVAEKRGVPKNSVTTPLFNAAIEKVILWLVDELYKTEQTK